MKAAPAVWRVVATSILVTGHAGRLRRVLLYRCACGSRHMASTTTGKNVLRRKPGCGIGPVMLHVGDESL